ncbi:hypothetical protein GDO78_002283 [Eleutherodactylus coqui]|uniref:Uncharacterized protein n=1 Tax=Eleutherodactylus coqui TaxID=57060 RepID=A0A8J6K263_ELECQ|nr:hypothetical protein GDO78_002283 [Eleutherodactylus coqui]
MSCLTTLLYHAVNNVFTPPLWPRRSRSIRHKPLFTNRRWKLEHLAVLDSMLTGLCVYRNIQHHGWRPFVYTIRLSAKPNCSCFWDQKRKSSEFYLSIHRLRTSLSAVK